MTALQPITTDGPTVSPADVLDDAAWFADHARRRYRCRPAAGGWWLIRRRGRGVMLRTFTPHLPPGLPDTDDVLRRAWFEAAWPALAPRTRTELVREARKAERGAKRPSPPTHHSERGKP